MREAPEAVVAAVQVAMDCEPFWATRCAEPHGECLNEEHDDWTNRGCAVAVQVADAAWEASLLAAAERFDERESEMRGARTLLAAGACKAASRTLRRWADEEGQA